MTVFNYHGYNCEVVKSNYHNGAIALQLIAAETENNTQKDTYPGELICCATVCLPGIELRATHTFIHNYAEKTGILDVLVEAGIVKPTGIEIPTGHVTVPVVEVLI